MMLKSPSNLLLATCTILVFLAQIAHAVTASSCRFPISLFNQTLEHDISNHSPESPYAPQSPYLRVRSQSSPLGNGTFPQQYQLNTTYFRPGGPILFLQSGENPLTCVDHTVLQDWSKELGAIAASVEHRYFGLSVPARFNATTATPSQYAHLTMNNT